jgi:hypothetical protein
MLSESANDAKQEESEYWKARVVGLEWWICELLIKNECLRRAADEQGTIVGHDGRHSAS